MWNIQTIHQIEQHIEEILTATYYARFPLK